MKAAVVSIAKSLPDPAEVLQSERASIIAELAEADRRLAKLREAEREEENVIKRSGSGRSPPSAPMWLAT